MAIVTTPITTFDRATPNDGLLFGSEFAQLYANDVDLQAQVTAASDIAGILGGLTFNTVSVPPTLQSGKYGISSGVVTKLTNTTLATTDTFNQSRQSFETFCHYNVFLNSAGLVKYLLYGESVTSSGSITSIAGAGTTKTITFSATITPSMANKILVVIGNSGVNGVFKIASHTSGTATATFESVSTLTGTGGTFQILERISTLHGAGANTAITVDADILKYTPSYGENGWASGIVAFDLTKNGYYCTIAGYEDYRAIGNFRTNGSSQVITDVVSHMSGRDKNDNFFFNAGVAVLGYGATDTKILRFDPTGNKYVFGCDYKYLDSSANGTRLSLNRPAREVSSSYNCFPSGGANLGISKNSTQLTTQCHLVTDGSMLKNDFNSVSCSHGPSCGSRGFANDIYRPHTDGTGMTTDAGGKISLIFSVVL